MPMKNCQKHLNLLLSHFTNSLAASVRKKFKQPPTKARQSSDHSSHLDENSSYEIQIQDLLNEPERQKKKLKIRKKKILLFNTRAKTTLRSSVGGRPVDTWDVETQFFRSQTALSGTSYFLGLLVSTNLWYINNLKVTTMQILHYTKKFSTYQTFIQNKIA